MAYSRFRRSGFQSSPNTSIIACVMFQTVPHIKLQAAILKLVHHMTGDKTITEKNLQLAMKFCGPRLKKISSASFLKEHRAAFKVLVKSLEGKPNPSERKIAREEFCKTVAQTTATIPKGWDDERREWASFVKSHQD